jgi:hypothetical protein
MEGEYERDLQLQMAKLQLVSTRGEKNKRIQMKRNKILEDNLLYEEEDEDEDEEESEEAGSNEEEREYGPHGEIYASSSSGEEEIEAEDGVWRPKRMFIPRCKLHAYKEAEGLNIRTQKRKPMKFTKGTDPRHKDILSFILDESIGCPHFLPLGTVDINITNVLIEAAIQQSHIPLSEHIKKENFYKFFQAFTSAIAADPALIKTEILGRLNHYDMLYGVKHDKRKTNLNRFTQGDYRRFAALFYLQTRRLMQETEFLMSREKRKRIMPRHLLTSAKLIGLIPN